jgi:hypothetical protein
MMRTTICEPFGSDRRLFRWLCLCVRIVELELTVYMNSQRLPGTPGRRGLRLKTGVVRASVANKIHF